MAENKMQRQVVLSERQAIALASTLRATASFGEKLLSPAQVEDACEWADQLYPLPDGPWRPEDARRKMAVT